MKTEELQCKVCGKKLETGLMSIECPNCYLLGFKKEIKKCKKETLKQVEKLIDEYLKEEKEICLSIEREWKNEEKENKVTKLGVSYPRIYSNQYFAFEELKYFWEELKSKLNKLKEK